MSTEQKPEILLANLVIESAKVREESFDKEACDNATKVDQIVDYSRFYKLTIREACQQVCEKHNQSALTEPVFLMLYTAWNDAVVWANKVVKK